MASIDTTAVPPARLAALLVSRRRELGIELAEISRRDPSFTPALLSEIERGRVQLAGDQLDRLVGLYELDAGPLVPGRSELVLDLEAGRVGVGGTVMPFETPTADLVLDRYLSLVYLLRDEQPGHPLVLRDDDMGVLSTGLSLPAPTIVAELERRMVGPEPTAFERLRSSRLIAGAGVLVGATAVGTLVLINPLGGDAGTQVATDSDRSALALGGSSALASSAGIHPATDPGAAASAATAPTTIRVVPATQATPRLEAAPSTGAAPAEVATADVASSSQVELAEPVTMESTTAAVDREPAPPADTTDRLSTVGEAALAASPWNLQAMLPGWTFGYDADSDHYHGLTNSRTRTIIVFIGDGDTPGAVAEVLMHEVGHAIDLEYLDDEDRLAWVTMRGMPEVWWAGDGLSDFAVGAGDFAEAVAAVAVGSPSDSVYGEFTAEQLAFVRAIIARTGV